MGCSMGFKLGRVVLFFFFPLCSWGLRGGDISRGVC